MDEPVLASGRWHILQEFAHALGAPLCALEVVLTARDHLPPAQGELLEEAVVRLRQILADAQGPFGSSGR